MLSVATLKSGTQKYNHYLSKEWPAYSNWFGIGAKKLGLEGEVDFSIFENLLNGILPNGEDITDSCRKKQKIKDLSYILTFSVSETISMYSLEDPTMIEAHHKSVFKILQTIEDTITARILINGKGKELLTKNMVAAIFFHTTVRKGPAIYIPSLHTHCVIFDMTAIENIWSQYQLIIFIV